MNQFELWAMLVIVAAASAAGGFCVGLEDECPEIDTDAQMILLMDECERCKDGEAKNWEDAQYKRIDQLEKCEEKLIAIEKRIKKLQKKLSTSKTTCGPWEWTCEETCLHAAIWESALLECEGPWQATPILYEVLRDYPRYGEK